MPSWWWMYCFILIYLFVNLIHATILLYDTDNRLETQAFDCIYDDGRIFADFFNPETTQSVKYCIRSNESVSIDRNYLQGCFNEGELIPFEGLKQLNISSQDMLKWNSGVYIVDRYQFYLK
jgi:hypothetical protein